jgi:hypothetical protein
VGNGEIGIDSTIDVDRILAFHFPDEQFMCPLSNPVDESVAERWTLAEKLSDKCFHCEVG